MRSDFGRTFKTFAKAEELFSKGYKKAHQWSVHENVHIALHSNSSAATDEKRSRGTTHGSAIRLQFRSGDFNSEADRARLSTTWNRRPAAYWRDWHQLDNTRPVSRANYPASELCARWSALWPGSQYKSAALKKTKRNLVACPRMSIKRLCAYATMTNLVTRHVVVFQNRLQSSDYSAWFMRKLNISITSCRYFKNAS